jgi:hypothetical protein
MIKILSKSLYRFIVFLSKIGIVLSLTTEIDFRHRTVDTFHLSLTVFEFFWRRKYFHLISELRLSVNGQLKFYPAIIIYEQVAIFNTPLTRVM